MSGVEILMIVAIVMQLVAMITAILLIRETKYSLLWISCIIGLMFLSVERILQLRLFDGFEVSNLTFAWMGIIVSVCFSTGVVCARLLVNHVDRMAYHRRLLENRLMTAVIRTEERSRASISRELHDGLGPLLSSAKMSLSALSRAELSDRDRATLQNTAAVIDEAIRSLRDISNNLSPHVLNNFGLMRGIKNFVDRTTTLHNIEIEFKTTLGDQRFDSNIEVIIYRVVCELINNSLKHSNGTKITITLTHKLDRITLDYSDNGCGFAIDEVGDSGMGLSNIRSRVQSLGGKFRLASGKGEGMSAHITVSTSTKMLQMSKRDIRRLKIRERNGEKS
ncbi:MAG: sensor histidine kinase [Alistipes sp.]|nr:sensor histidine kinase [Alistipes sp.]